MISREICKRDTCCRHKEILLKNEQEAYTEITYYTLSHSDPAFIHQLVVDAFAAQTAAEDDKPIKLTFALVGLYLHVEQGFTGRQVQLAHMQLARVKQQWPPFSLPEERGMITAVDVVEAPSGPERDAMIHRWCASVWEAYSGDREIVVHLLRRNKMIFEKSILHRDKKRNES